MITPKVSIIVPVYNVEKYFHRCVQSLLNQTIKDIEIILIDDESPDNCYELCNAYKLKDSRIKVIHKKNEGLGFARNSGLDIATGEFVAFVDSDDYVSVEMFEKLYDLAKTNALDVVYCGFNTVSENLEVSPINEVNTFKVFESKDKVLGVLLDMIGAEPADSTDRKYQMSVWHALYSKSIIDQNKIRFHSEREFISEDIIFHIDYLQKAKKIAFTPDSLYYYCSNESSLSSSFRKDRFERYKILREELIRRIGAIDGIPPYKLKIDRLFIGYSRSLIFSLYQYKMPPKQRKDILKEICSDPIWQQLSNSYPYWRLPLKYAFIFLCVRFQFLNILLKISQLEIKRKNIKK